MISDSLLVSNVMKTDVKTENENQNVISTCETMCDNYIGLVVVKRDQNNDRIPVGIITERDIVRV
jgi:predicted transcriptional regulator